MQNTRGKRLVLRVIEERAKSEYSQAFASLPISNDPRHGFRDVTYAALLKAIDRCAWFLSKHVDSDIFAWLTAPTDFRYVLLAYACMKTGHKAFYPSVRNSVDAHLALLKNIDCKFLLQPNSPRLPIVNHVLGKYPMQVVEMPDLRELLWDDTEVAPYKFNKSFEDARYQPCLILHTSGSTGIPKPVTLTQGWFSVVDAFHDMPDMGVSLHGLSLFQGLRAFIPFPNFHAAAIIMNLGVSVFFDVTIVFAPEKPLSAELADMYHNHANVQATFLPASILRELMTEEESVRALERLQFVHYGGSALPLEVGEKLRHRVHLTAHFGITETSMLPFEVTDPEDWKYLRMGPKTGCRFDEVAPGQYELVIEKDPRLDLLQGVFTTYPHLNEFRTKDTWSKHPTKENHWFYEGRTDDIIVFDNGEKLNPLTMEQIVETNDSVSSALVAGTGRFQACLLIEPREPLSTSSDQNALIDSVWDSIERANNVTVAHGRVDRSFVMCASPKKPFLRASKGSVQRKLTVDLYSHEIEQLYEPERANDSGGSQSLYHFDDFIKARKSLRSLVVAQLGYNIESDDSDFFSQGMDSLHVANMSRKIKAATHSSNISSKLIYGNPTVNQLAAAMTDEPSGNPTDSRDNPIESRNDRMQALFDDMSKDLPMNARTPEMIDEHAITVLLTGSTGSLGNYMLHSLIEMYDVRHIYCLNRSSDAKERQTSAHEVRGLSLDFVKVDFLQADLVQERLGLKDIEIYRKLLQDVTCVVHNAWAVDFNRPLRSFRPHTLGVRKLIEFASRSAHQAHLLFLSSISTVQNWKPSDDSNDTTAKVPEQIFRDWAVSQPLGYAEAKHVSEIILQEASAISGLDVTICRVGQIAGPVLRGQKGMWQKQEWLPSLIFSSCAMKKIPQSLGALNEIDWIPVDILGEIIAEIMVGSTTRTEMTGQCRITQIVNRQSIPWDRLLPAILEALPMNRRPEVVPFAEWVEALQVEEQTSLTSEDVVNIPALKLVNFFTSTQQYQVNGKDISYSQLAVGNASDLSRTLRETMGVSPEWMGLWMRQWGF